MKKLKDFDELNQVVESLRETSKLYHIQRTNKEKQEGARRMTKTEKTYYVCKSYVYGTAKTYYEASQNVDFLSCEAIHPVLKIKAHNKKEAIKRFKELTKQ